MSFDSPCKQLWLEVLVHWFTIWDSNLSFWRILSASWITRYSFHFAKKVHWLTLESFRSSWRRNHPSVQDFVFILLISSWLCITLRESCWEKELCPKLLQMLTYTISALGIFQVLSSWKFVVIICFLMKWIIIVFTTFLHDVFFLLILWFSFGF